MSNLKRHLFKMASDLIQPKIAFPDLLHVVMLLVNINALSIASYEVKNLPLRTTYEHYMLVIMFEIWRLFISTR